jgi:hypothetical protein
MNLSMIPIAQPGEALSGADSSLSLEGVVDSARELVAFSEREPILASRAGVEVLALEAKMLMRQGNLLGARRSLGRSDLGLLQRLDGIVSISNNRIGECIASMDHEMSGSAFESLSRIVGLAGGAIGIIRSIF